MALTLQDHFTNISTQILLINLGKFRLNLPNANRVIIIYNYTKNVDKVDLMTT